MKLPCSNIPEVVSNHLKRHQSSGLSIVAYCRENNIRPATFYGWNKRYKKALSATVPTEQSKLPFIEIPVKSSLHSESNSPVRVAHTEITIPLSAIAQLGEAFNDYIKVLLSEKRPTQ